MICQACGVEAPTKHVAFYQNIGALVMRFSRTAEGDLCKSCIHKIFWSYTLINLFLGWWGVISFIVTPFFILNNVFRYLLCLGMAPVPAGAQVPRLTEAEITRLQPLTQELFDRLHQGEDFDYVAENIALKACVTKGQVALYVHALVSRAQQQKT
jgi:hypothetical protein